MHLISQLNNISVINELTKE